MRPIAAATRLKCTSGGAILQALATASIQVVGEASRSAYTAEM
jgi:hypothetical protein